MPDSAANPLIGTWWLVSLEYETASEISYSFGRDAQGYLFAAEASGDRPPFARGDHPLAGTVEEKAAGAGSYLIYCGRYEFMPDRVVRQVNLSLFPNWVGQQQVRYFDIAGDRATLKSRRMLADAGRRKPASSGSGLKEAGWNTAISDRPVCACR